MPISISDGSGPTPVSRVGIRGPSANSTMAATYGMSPTKSRLGAWWTIENACSLASPLAGTQPTPLVPHSRQNTLRIELEHVTVVASLQNEAPLRDRAPVGVRLL